MTKSCGVCGDPVPAIQVGRPRRFCSNRCRNERNKENAVLRNRIDRLRDWADECRDTASRFRAQRHAESVTVGWERRAVECDTEADDLERFLADRAAGLEPAYPATYTTEES